MMFDKMKKTDAAQGWQKETVLFLHDLIYMLTVMLFLMLIIFREMIVSGPSMKMTLLDGDYLLLVSNVVCGEPHPGDIVVVSKQSFDHGKPIVKRVIATEGQIVDIDFENGIVYVDGLPLEEDYTNTPTNVEEGMLFPLIIEEGSVFVMGDNRNHSKDSRSLEIGQVDKREIVGKAFLRFYPGTDGGNYPRDFSRIGLIK